MPDRGDLVAYPAQRVVRRDGAYTWHRADLSEAHALAAIADGSLRITTPAGEALDFVYERHEEHASGDWTWVGRLERGAAADEVVLTFGDQAAFGTIAQPGKEPLRLTIRDGAAWLIETDAARVADIRNRATQPEGPDYFVPPSSVASREADTAGSGPTTASAPSTAAATSSSTPVIDLVLGYTPGFTAMYGGQSQAVTRLNNMVAITNEAYANSQITGRVRLVHTLQVSYADNTDNGDALEKLSGYKSGTGWITTDPAFSALRAARDQYGADLVSLVRRFNDPENDGCGIAWMIGGGGTSVDTGDAPFGYSVVSDGEDQGADGKTYFCRNETLAHEIGHNLGSQHDRATATKDGKISQGAYSYSFGYKTNSANGNFYTVMAYGDSGQTRYRVFSSPRVTFCGGLPCGVVDQADNARSQDQTMPVIAQFRATAVAPAPTPSRRAKVRWDVDGDLRSDLIWFNPGLQRVAYWAMGGNAISRHGGQYTGSGYRVMAVGDYDGNGRADLIWRGVGGDLQMWFSDGVQFGWRPLIAHPDGWNFVGSHDMDGDGKDDLIWHHVAMQRIAIWHMDGNVITRHGGFMHDAGYAVIGAGDYNGDSRTDVLWRGNGGDLRIWLGADTGFVDSSFAGYPAGWSLLGSHDVDGDRRADLVWYHPVMQRVAYWILDGATVVRHGGQVSGGGYQVVAMGDYDADERADLIWLGPSGDLQMWFSNGMSFDWRPFVQYPGGWQLLSGR